MPQYPIPESNCTYLIRTVLAAMVPRITMARIKDRRLRIFKCSQNCR